MLDRDRPIVVGRIVGTHGLLGWVKIQSFTEPPEAILGYLPWRFSSSSLAHQRRDIEVLETRVDKKNIFALFAKVTTCDQAKALCGFEIVVARSVLGEPEPGSFFWADLEGLQVIGEGGQVLGSVSHLFAAGNKGSSTLVVSGEHGTIMIPFVIGQVVREVNLDQGTIVVNWGVNNSGDGGD